MKKKILVAGGTGFLGYHLLKELRNLNYSLYSLSSKKPKNYRRLSNVKYIICNVTNKKKLIKELKVNFNYVVNFSGYVDHSNKQKTMRSHYHGCKNLINFFKNKKIINFIQIGSSMEYGNAKSPHKEKLQCKPKGTYAIAKYKATKYLQEIGRKENFPFTILRLYQVYGPYQSKNRLIPIVIDACIKKKKFACSSGSQIRDFLYVDDLIKLIIKLIKTKPKNKIYNIGAGKNTKVRTLIELIQKLIGKGTPDFGKIKMRKDETLHNFPNINRVKKDYKWTPKYNIKNGLSKTIKFYEKKK